MNKLLKYKLKLRNLNSANLQIKIWYLRLKLNNFIEQIFLKDYRQKHFSNFIIQIFITIKYHYKIRVTLSELEYFF